LAHVGEGHRAICWHVLLEPVLVASTVECTGDHTEVLLAKAHDGEVSTESTTWGEQWCVDRTANSNINIVYTINEPTAIGACAALKAAKKTAIVVSVDGGLSGIEAVKSGCIGATSQQYPLRMADIGLQAIYDLVKSGKKPEVTPGKDFFDTGVTLITDDPQEGVPSESVQYGLDNAWG